MPLVDPQVAICAMVPSPLNAFNDLADLLTRNTVATVIEEARASHLLHHQYATALR